MRELISETIKDAITGKLVMGKGDRTVSRVVTDSREAGPEDVFFALVGEKNDGHDYLGQVFEKGCKVVVASDVDKVLTSTKGTPEADLPDVILVPDTKKALQKLSAWYLDSLDLKAKVGVTGSVGKTSTRDFLYYVLSEGFRTSRSIKNYNNSFGLPLSLLSFSDDSEAAVIEMGMDGKGSIDLLADLVRPETAVITNVGVSHMENFPGEGRMGILNTKLEITNYFDEDSTLIINASNDMLSDLDMAARGIPGRLIKVGTDEGCDYISENVVDNGTEGIEFDLRAEGKSYHVTLPVPGAHNSINAALAIACGVRYGLSIEEAIRGLERVELTEKRLTLREKDGITVIDDTYNAAPDSVKSAINTLMATKVPEGGRRILITGDMGELGTEAKAGHRSIGEYSFEKGVDVHIAIGELSVNTLEGWRNAALAAGHELEEHEGEPHILIDVNTGRGAEHFNKKETVMDGIREHIHEGDCILVKASRYMQLEKIVKAITEDQ